MQNLSDVDRLPPGEGSCNFDNVLTALKEIDYQGYLSLEVGFDTRKADPDWYASTSIRYLRKQTEGNRVGLVELLYKPNKE